MLESSAELTFTISTRWHYKTQTLYRPQRMLQTYQSQKVIKATQVRRASSCENFTTISLQHSRTFEYFKNMPLARPWNSAKFDNEELRYKAAPFLCTRDLFLSDKKEYLFNKYICDWTVYLQVCRTFLFSELMKVYALCVYRGNI